MTAHETIRIAQPVLDDHEWRAVRESLDSGMLVQGARVEAFEVAFARRHRTPHAVATVNGTAALHVALVGLGIGPGDDVIVPAFTWVSTANAVLYAGATPVFIDVLPDTYNIDVSLNLAPVW